MDNTITLNFEINGQQAVQTFDNVKKASESVLHTVNEIKNAATDMLPESELTSFMEGAETTIQNTFTRIRAIDKQRESPTLSNYKLESLNAERELLRRSIEATMQDLNDFTKLSSEITKAVGGKGKGRASKLKALTDAMPEFLSFATEAARIQQTADALYDSSKFKAQMKISAVQKGTFDRLGINANSKVADQILEYAMLRGASQVQRGDFMSRISRGASTQSHVFGSFAEMLPQAFRQFHTTKGTTAVPAQDANKTLSDKEYAIVRSLLTENPYFAKAAERAGVAYRTNGMMRLADRNILTRGMVNGVAANLYDTIINSAKGMPMYGITDVDDPQMWERIARKTNKPFIGSTNASRSISDLLPWVTPTRTKRTKLDQAAFEDAGIIDFSPMIKRYEVAKYTIDDLEKGVQLNGRKRKYDENKEDHYFPVDHSLHLETIFKARGRMPEHNAAVNDVVYVPLDPRIADPNLPEKEREKLYKRYAPYIENGMTLNVGGKQVKYRYTKGNPSLGLEFIPEELYNKIKASDNTFFTGGLDPNFKTKDWTEFTKAIEYATKNSTSGENIRDLFGTELPKKLNIAIFDAEESAKGPGGTGAGMNGASYINRKYVPVGFQARMPGIKTALNTLDPKGVSDMFGSNAMLTGPEGSVIRLTGNEDLILSWGDIKNASGQRFKDANGNMLPIEEIKKRINDEIQSNGIFASRTMPDANGRAHWLSGQLAQILKGDDEFVKMSTKAFLDEYRNAGTLQGALNSVFANDSETKDLLLRTSGAALGERQIQQRIQEYREQLVSRVSRGDVMLPSDVKDQRAMAAPWIFNAISSAMKKINYEGTVQTEKGHTDKTFYDYMYEHLDKDQRKALGLITMADEEVAFTNSVAEALGIERYPATSQSARKVKNVTAGNSERARALKNAIAKAGLDENAVFISPSSPVLDMLQDMDFDGDVVELIDLAVTGYDKKNKRHVTSAEVLDRAITLGQKRIDDAYNEHKITKEEREARKEQLKNTVYKSYETTGKDANKFFSLASGLDTMRAIGAASQNGSYMGAPDASIRRAMQAPGSKEVFLALADAENQYSVNSVRGKKGYEIAASKEQINVMTRYRPFTELFRMVDKARDERGNVVLSDLREAARSSDGLEGGKIWATNLPFATMSSNVRQALLSRFLAKRAGVDINKQYDWENIFNEILGERNNETALGRMQSGLRDVFAGILNADYLAPSSDTIAALGKLRDEAIKEEMGKVAAERRRLGKAFDKKGSDERIATQYVNRLGGLAIENAQEGLVMDEAALAEGDNKAMMDALAKIGITDVVGNPDLTALLNGVTTPEAFNRAIDQNSGTTELFRLLQRYNLFSQEQKKSYANRFSFSSIERFATNPTEFLKTLMFGYKPNTNAATEVGYASHAAIEHFMQARRTAAENGIELGEKELAAAQQEAVAIFDEYLGLQQGDRKYLVSKGSIPTRGFSDAEREEARRAGTRLNERYTKARAFIAGDLSKVYPEKDWEVVGIESSNVGNDQQTPGGKMRIHGMGQKAKTPAEEVDFTGAYDLLFKNRSTGMYAMADIKNYLDGATPENWKKWMVQQATYARQMRDNGIPISEVGIIMPYDNRVRTQEFTDADLNDTKNNMSQAVSTIQNALTAGDVTVASLLEASQMVNELLFGKNSNAETIEKLKNEQRARDVQAQNEGKTTPGTILNALTLHDQYKEAEDIEGKITGFINAKTRNKEDTPSPIAMWTSQYNNANKIKGIAENFAANGRQAEAADLEKRYNDIVYALDTGISKAVESGETQYEEALNASILGRAGTKNVNSLIEQYKTINQARQDRIDERSFLAKQIEETKKRTEDQKAIVASYDEALKSNERENAFIDKMLGYGVSIKETKKPQFKSARTRYFNNSEFASEYGEAFLGKSEEDIETALAERKKLLEENSKTAEQGRKEANNKAEVLDLLTLGQEQALELTNKRAEQTEPVYDQYVKQVADFAKKDIESTISGLEQAIGMGGTDGLQQAVESTRLKYVTNAKNGLTDIDNLVKAGILDEQSAEGMRTRITNLMTDEALNLLDENTRNALAQRQGLAILQQDARHNQLVRQSRQLERDPFGVRRDVFARSQAMRDQIVSRLEQQRIQQKADINTLSNWQRDNQHKVGTDEYNENAKKLSAAQAALNETEASLGTLSTGWGTAAAAMAQFGQVLDSVVKRLGRQLFNKAIQETKRFVQEYNRGLTSIQMITLKTDAEMGKLGDGLIAKAQELKVTISEVMSSAETLYRQGLNDEEVSERLDVISKFSKVSGTKIDAATKLITVAMNTGLVSNPQTAADIVTALGDSAATNASEIEKGIEKAGAAAAADGTTFAQLASMLTAITSTTQIGGNVAGRTLNTIFGRMNKIGTSELIYDENGNAVSGSAVAKLLQEAGVDTYRNGQKRSSYDVLFDLSQRWDGMSDAKQQQIAAAIAGTRQYSNFSAIMTGMAEGKVSEYMGLTGESGGIVDEKYEVYTRSLEAALIDVRNAWDALVAGLTDKGTLTGFLDTITSIINGVNKWSDSIGGLGAALTAVLPILLGYAAVQVGLRVAAVKPLAGLALVAGGAAAIGITALAAKASGGVDSSKAFEGAADSYSSIANNSNDAVSQLTSLMDKGRNRTTEEDKEYATLINRYAVEFGAIGKGGDDAAFSLSNLTASINGIGEAADSAAKTVIQAAKAVKDYNWAMLINGNRSGMVSSIEADITEGLNSLETQKSIANPIFDRFWGLDEEQKKYVRSSGYGTADIFGFLDAYDDTIKSILLDAKLRGINMGEYEDLFSTDASGVQQIDKYGWSRLVNGISTGKNNGENFLDLLFNILGGESAAPTENGVSSVVESVFGKRLRQVLAGTEYDNEGVYSYLSQNAVGFMSDYLSENGTDIYGASRGQLQSAITAYLNSIFGTELDPQRINDTLRVASQNKATFSRGQIAFGLPSLGKYDYIVDRNGQKVSLADVDNAETQMQQEMHNRLIGLVQQSNARRQNDYKEAYDATVEENKEISKQTGAEQYADQLRAEYDKQIGRYFGERIDESTLDFSNVDTLYEQLRNIAVEMWREGATEASPQIEQAARELKEGFTFSPDISGFALKDLPNAEQYTMKDLPLNATVEQIESWLATVEDLPDDIREQYAEAEAEIRAKYDQYKVIKGSFFDNLYESANTLFGQQKEKNASAYAADTLLNLMNVNKYSNDNAGLSAFFNDVFGDSVLQQALLNAENISGVSELILQTKYNSNTGRATGPENAIEHLRTLLMGGSATHGKRAFTEQETAAMAQRAYDSLSAVDYDSYNRYLAEWNNMSAGQRAHFVDREDFLNQYVFGNIPEEERDALRGIIGDNLFTRLQNGELDSVQDKYVRQRLALSNAGLSDFTARQRLENMNDVFENFGSGYDRDVAKAYMSQWSNWAEYADLRLREGSLTPEESERYKTLTQEFETLRKNAEIEIKVEGVKALEDAGKVAEGTASALEAMAKGGKAAADAMMSLQRSGYSEGQSRAKLYNGTKEQQYEAARALIGMSEDEFYADPYNNLIAAKAYDKAYQQEIDRNTIKQLYLNASTKEEQAFAERYAASKGFTIDTREGYGKAVFSEKNLKVNNVSPIRYASRIYTDKEKMRALDDIVNGNVQYSNNNAELFMAAYETGGAYTKELVRRKMQGLTITPDIERGAKNEQLELSRVFAEDYDLSTAAGMYGYNQAQREWNNRAALSANTIYSELSSGNITSVQELMQSVSDHSKDWVNLLDSSEELNKQFSDLGVKYDSKTGTLDFSKVTASGEAFAAAIEAMTVTAGQASEKFAEITQILSTGETAERALEYLNGTRNDDLGYAAFSEYIGNDSVAAYVKNNRINGRDALAGLEDNAFVSNYVNSLLENARLGISGLTDVQRYEGLMNIVSSSNIGSLYENNMFGAFEDYLQSVSGASDWVNATQVLQQNKMSWADVRNGANLPEEFTKIYSNTQVATEADEAFRNSLLETGRTLKTSGKNLSEYSNGLNISSKDLKTSTNALKNYRSMLATFSNNQFLRNLYRSGNRESRVKEYVKSLGFTEEDFKDVNMQQSILDAMLNEENAEKLDLENTLSGVMDGIQQEVTNYVKSHEIYVDGQQINVGSGSVTVSTDELLSKFEGALELTQNEAVQQALAHGAEIDWQVTWGNDVTTIKPVVKSLGARSSGGGGGGGGGKSKSDKLLEAQKHRIEAIQHENNMLEIEADNYARVNNITGYEDTVDKQIAGQEKLRAAYRQNISEIKQQMSNVKKESDDWYKLVEALHSAEEAYAKVAAAIDDLIKKQLQEHEQLYSFRTSLSTHEKNMLDVWRNRYTRNNDYNNMNHNIDEQVANARAQQALDIAWANELAAKIQEQYDLGNNDTDTVREWRQNLNEIVEKIANSTEEIAELEASRLNVIQTQRENALVFPEHVSRMYDYDQEMMQLNNNYTGLIRSYDAEYANVRSEYDVWEQSRAQLVDLLASQTIGSTSWYDVRNELFAADEQLKELELELAQIEQNRITEEINYFNARSDWDSGNRQHNLNMIQSEQSYYQSRDELTNYGFMLEKEQEVHQANVEAAQNELVLLNRQREALEEQGMAGTENYNTIIDLIKTREELIRSETATLEENTKKLRENQEAILKTRQELESLIDTEIKTREEERKKRLAATVSMENTILETIKKRYKDEWDLIREDMAKKREALNKEKSLINERLNARKQAASMEEKYSELEEYQRQLALIANDPTRSKDAKQLRDKVQELQKSLSWEEATQEAQASMQTIDDEIKSMADYEAYGTEALNEMLTFADNFSEEISTIMEGGWTSISDFLTRNNEAFINSLDSNQQQMLEGWEQTWKNMKGIVDTYWEQVNEIISSPEMVLAYMMGSTQYQNQSGVGQQLLISQWEDLVRRYLASTAVSPDAQYYEMDDHPWYEGSGDLGAVDDYSWLGQGFSGYDTPENGVNMPVDNGRTIFPEEQNTSSSGSSGGGNGGDGRMYYRVRLPRSGNGTMVYARSPEDAIKKAGNGSIVGDVYVSEYVTKNSNGEIRWSPEQKYTLPGYHISTNPAIYYTTQKAAETAREGYANQYLKVAREMESNSSDYTFEELKAAWDRYYAASNATISRYKSGGLVDYTGPAWVDGTPTQPESFLDAVDTENLRNLTDALTHVSVSGGIWPGGDDFGGGDINYGDIYVTINQAELKNDADFDAVAKRVGKSFVKEMSRNGFNLTKYNL